MCIHCTLCKYMSISCAHCAFYNIIAVFVYKYIHVSTVYYVTQCMCSTLHSRGVALVCRYIHTCTLHYVYTSMYCRLGCVLLIPPHPTAVWVPSSDASSSSPSTISHVLEYWALRNSGVYVYYIHMYIHVYTRMFIHMCIHCMHNIIHLMYVYMCIGMYIGCVCTLHVYVLYVHVLYTLYTWPVCAMKGRWWMIYASPRRRLFQREKLNKPPTTTGSKCVRHNLRSSWWTHTTLYCLMQTSMQTYMYMYIIM